MAKEIDIKLRTTYDGKGGDQAKRHLNGIAGAFSKIGEALGGANVNLGRFMNNFIKGGIWGAAAELVGFIIKKTHEWFTASERAEKEAAKIAKEAHDERMKCLDEYSAAIDKLSQKRVNAINQNVKAVNEELDATKELTKALLELEKAEARKRGDSGRMADIDRELSAVDAQAARMRLQNEIDATQKRRQSGERDLADARIGRDRANNEVRWMQAVIEDRLTAVSDEARKNAKGRLIVMPSSAGSTFVYGSATEADRQAAADRSVATFKNSDEYRELNRQLEDARKRSAVFGEKADNAKNAIRQADDQERNLRDRLSAVDIREQARIRNEEAIAAEEARKAEEKRIAEVKAAEIKAAAEAAKERERLDREAHQKRMDDIRAELVAAAGPVQTLRTTAANAQNEFDRAFAMFRDPAHAASVVADEKGYQQDLDRLHRDASRYGGKWRIDELSSLMAAGGSQSVTDTLSAWRRNRGFTPQVEAMVRASAAEQTKTTVEDELRKIGNNTADLARKLDELLAMKGD